LVWNTIAGPAEVTVTVSLIKRIAPPKSNEAMGFRCQAKVYNILLNRASFRAPEGRVFSGTTSGWCQGNAGFVKSGTTAYRRNQFALKLLW